MKECVEALVKSLVDYPEYVEIFQVEEENSIILEVQVSPGDIKKFTGNHGLIAESVRIITKSIALSMGKKVMLEISERNGEELSKEAIKTNER